MLTKSKVDRGDVVPAYRLRCLGDVRLSDAAGEDCTPRSRKTRALLVYVLLFKGAAVSRERLATLLWGDRADEQARASLRQALYELKALSGGAVPLLAITREQVIANADAVAVDLDEAESLAQAGDLAALNELLHDQQLLLLADLDGITADFDDWLRSERAQRTDRLIALCVTAGQTTLARNERSQSEAVRSLVATLESLDPLSEPVVRLGIQADTACGDAAQAHRRYRRFEERLERELATRPSAETRALLAKRQARDAAPNVDGPALTGSPHVPANGPSSAEPATAGGARETVADTNRSTAAGSAHVSASGTNPDEPATAASAYMRAAAADANTPTAAESLHEPAAAGSGHMRATAVDANRSTAAGGAHLSASTNPDVPAIAGSAHVRAAADANASRAAGSVHAPARLAGADSQAFPSTPSRAWHSKRSLALAIALTTLVIGSVAFGTWRYTQNSGHNAQELSLQAQALMRDRREPDLTRARSLLLEATELNPEYAPAWANLAIVTMLLSDQTKTYGTIPAPQARNQALHYANRAVNLDPNLATAHAALGLITISDERAIPHYQRAIELDPNRAEYHRWLGQAYENTGRPREAFVEHKRALEAEPLWAQSAEILIAELADQGRENEIDSVVRQFNAVSKVPFDRKMVQFVAHRERGELQQMLAIGRELLREQPNEHKITVGMASIFAGLGDRQSALALLQPNDVLIRAIVSHDLQEIERVARESPSMFWHDELDDVRAGEMLVANGQGRLLLQLFDTRYGDMARIKTAVPELIASAPALIVALREAGRQPEAAELNRLVLDRIRADLANGISPVFWSFEHAQQLALAGDRDGALAELQQLMQQRWCEFLVPPFVPFTDLVAFRDFRTDPRLMALQQQFAERVRATREQIGPL
jgi:DNA-binding SARP family transcriptional activator